MSSVAVTPASITRAGVSATAAMVSAPATGAGNGIKFSNNGRRFVRIKNAGGTVCNATINIGATVDGQTVTARTITVPITTGDYFAGPWTTDYNQSDGTVTIDFDFVTSVTVGVFEL